MNGAILPSWAQRNNAGIAAAFWIGTERVSQTRYTPKRVMAIVAHPEAVLDAIFPAVGQPNLFQELEQEGLKAHRVRKVYLTARGQGDVLVDISETIEQKIESLKKHVSQVGGWEALADRIRESSAAIAEGKDMAYAEAYRVITLESDAAWEKLQQRGEE